MRTLTLASVLVLSGAAVAQPPAYPPPVPGAVPAAPAATYRMSQVLGSRVSLQNGLGIGIVEDVIFDDAGQVEYLVVANEGRHVPVPWQAAQFNFGQRTAVVNITPQQFGAIPTFTVNSYPNFAAPAYRTEIHRYYGLTPGQVRRIERERERR